MPYLRMQEDAEYQERLSLYLGPLILNKRLPALGMRMCHFDPQLDWLWYVWNHTDWATNVDMEFCARVGTGHDDVKVPRFFVGYHNLELWGITLEERSLVYCEVSEWWKVRYEVNARLRVPIPPLYSYYSGLLIDGSFQLNIRSRR